MPRLLPRLPYLPGSRRKQVVRLLFVLHSYFKEIGKCLGRFPLRDVLFGIRHGFAADRVFLYGRDAIVSGDYLTDLQRQFSRFINSKPARELLEDKLLLSSLLDRLQVCVPTNYLYCDNGRLIVVSEEWNKIICCRNPEKTYKFVLKRARGGGGIRIRFGEMTRDTVYLAGREMGLADFYQLFAQRNEHLLCKFIEQSEFCRRIYPDTTNTLRIICMREFDGEPFIARAVLRLGTRKSKGVDNFGQGGLAVSVDLETGTLGEAVEHYAKTPRAPSNYRCHPDTGAPIAGELLPGWFNARNVALRLMCQLPFLNYVGWDIVLTDSGPVVLEGNNYTGVRLAQIQSGLLGESRIRAFYQRFGMLPGAGATLVRPGVSSQWVDDENTSESQDVGFASLINSDNLIAQPEGKVLQREAGVD